MRVFAFSGSKHVSNPVTRWVRLDPNCRDGEIMNSAAS